jgi:hypothetical protein
MLLLDMALRYSLAAGKTTTKTAGAGPPRPSARGKLSG